MKKITLVICILSFFGKLLAQPQLISISPNTGNIGTPGLVTTISGANDIFLNGSPSGVRLFKSVFPYSKAHGKNTVVINNNQLLSTIKIPNDPNLLGTAGLELAVSDTSGGGNSGYYILNNCFTFVDTLPHVSGIVFLDVNQNGIKDGNEPPIAGAKVKLLPDSVFDYTDSYGQYHFATTTGNHVITWDSIPGQYYLLSPGNVPSYNVNLTPSSVINNLNFGLITNYPDYFCNVNLYEPFPRCNNNVTYSIMYNNLGNIPFNGNVVFVIDTGETFINAAPTPSSINGDTLIWNFTNLSPYINNYINVTVLMPGANNIVKNIATVNSLNGTAVVFTDAEGATQTISCSFDPNDKAVDPPGVQSANYTLFNIPLEYTIRFQNTGNDTAFTVSIKDFLDSDLDWSTLEIVGSSHKMQTSLDSLGEVTFTFNNILLPDSNVNEPGSHGFLRYRIRHKAGLTDYTPITNTAYIYFDLNPAVVTNTTLNTLVTIIPVSVNEIEKGNIDVKVTPNPTTSEVNFFFKNPDTKLYYLSITSSNGALVGSDYTQTGHFQFKKKSLSPGVYFYRITDNRKSIFTGKFIIN